MSNFLRSSIRKTTNSLFLAKCRLYGYGYGLGVINKCYKQELLTIVIEEVQQWQH